jgi:hypothetical protein
MLNASTKAWKAFKLDRQGRLRFLFHTHAGTSIVPLGTWMEAKSRWVRDASNHDRAYRSGFHIFRRLEDVVNFQNLTKGKYIVLPVLVANVWQKPHSRVGSWIAYRLYVPKTEKRAK